MIDDILTDSEWRDAAQMWKQLDEWERAQARRERRRHIVALLCTFGIAAVAVWWLG